MIRMIGRLNLREVVRFCRETGSGSGVGCQTQVSSQCDPSTRTDCSGV
jgi:hypothetical protein